MAEHTMPLYMSSAEARSYYDLRQTGALFASEIDSELADNGITRVAIPLTSSDFQQLISRYEACIDDCPDLLDQTYYQFDGRLGNEAGHVRKEQKISPVSGRQMADPKNIMHFTEGATKRWREQFGTLLPKSLGSLLLDGEAVHHTLLTIGKDAISELEATHPNISKAYFPRLGSQLESRIYAHCQL